MSSYLFNNPQVVSVGSDNAPDKQIFPEAASQSFKAGELVYLVSGKVTVCANDDPTLILGRASTDATGVTDSDIEVEIFKEHYRVKMQVSNNGTPATSDNAVLGTKYGIIIASNIHYIDVADTSNTRVRIENQNTDPDGTTYQNFAVVSFIGDNLQYG